MNFELSKLISTNVNEMQWQKPSSTCEVKVKISLDGNENALGSPLIKWYNRYPKNEMEKLKTVIASIKAVSVENILLSKGNLAVLDLLIRCFCNPGINKMISCPPCIGHFENLSKLNNVLMQKVPLSDDFQLNLIHLEHSADSKTNIIFIESPNSVAGNSMNRADIELILNNFNGLVVIDETYVNFSRQKSFVTELGDYPNLIILQNFDIAWGLAGLGVSMLIASEEIIALLNTIKDLHSINLPTQELMLKALEEVGMVNDMTKELVQMREALKKVLPKLPFVEKVYPSDANFLLVKMDNAKSVYNYLLQKDIAVKDVSHLDHCENCVRITLGTEEENTSLVEALVDYYDENWKADIEPNK